MSHENWECYYGPRHRWTVLSKTPLPSPLEQAARVGMELNLRARHIAEITRSDILVTYHCTCGAQKVERI